MPERPILLLIDGHKSHLTLECIDLARENQIILLCLPPHTTHALQPLDVAVFRALKAHFSRALRVCCFTKKNFIVSKRDFARVLKEPFELSFSIVNLKSGFSKCWIFPFNRNAVSSEKMTPSSVYQEPSKDKPVKESNSSGGQASEDNISGNSSAQDDSASTCVNPPASEGSQVSANSSSFTPPLFSTPNSSENAVSESSASRVSTPLVRSGLVPSNLADILAVADPEVQPKRRIVKARVVTENEYYEILKNKERKEKEAKERKRIEREQKKEEREKLKAEKALEREKKKQEREAIREAKKQQQKKGSRQKRRRSPSTSSDSEVELESVPGSRRLNANPSVQDG